MGGRVKWSMALIGERFGRLTVEGLAAPHPSGRTQARFRCDCGTLVEKVLTKVVQGHTLSCGCLKESPTKPTPLVEMVGRRFSRLVVIDQAQPSTSDGKTRWVCLCDCGTQKIVCRSNLVNGSTQSCGCLLREAAALRLSTRLKGKRSKGWKGIGEMSASFWGQICSGARSRGLPVEITHQEAWDLFQAQEGKCALTGLTLEFPKVGKRSGSASLDRVDSGKGYVTGNIQWVDKRIQQMKWNLPQEDFVSLCRSVVEHFGAKGHVVGA